MYQTYFLFNRSVQQLEYFTEDCRSISTIHFFDNKDILTHRISIRISNDGSKWPRRELVSHLLVCINNRQYLSYKICICVIRMENKTLNNTILMTVFMLYSPAFS